MTKSPTPSFGLLARSAADKAAEAAEMKSQYRKGLFMALDGVRVPCTGTIHLVESIAADGRVVGKREALIQGVRRAVAGDKGYDPNRPGHTVSWIQPSWAESTEDCAEFGTFPWWGKPCNGTEATPQRSSARIVVPRKFARPEQPKKKSFFGWLVGK